MTPVFAAFVLACRRMLRGATAGVRAAFAVRLAWRVAALTVAAVAPLVLVVVSPPLQAADLSRQYYVQYCVGCHQMDGSGSTASSIPDMRGQLGLFVRTERGRAFLAQVPGSANSPLGDAQLAQLLNWLVPAMGPGAVPESFHPYTAEEITQLRATVPADVTTRRREVVSELQAMGLPAK